MNTNNNLKSSIAESQSNVLNFESKEMNNLVIDGFLTNSYFKGFFKSKQYMTSEKNKVFKVNEYDSYIMDCYNKYIRPDNKIIISDYIIEKAINMLKNSDDVIIPVLNFKHRFFRLNHEIIVESYRNKELVQSTNLKKLKF
jgi:hypothetical protein